jgi:hypothetical protein
MPTPLPIFVNDTAQSVASPAQSPGWLREPLLHFLVLGALLFALDYLIAGRADSPHVILVDAAVDQQARQTFETARGRKPNEAELYALRRVWLDNEVLYREGLALAVDKGDTAIRERVIFKMLSVVDAGLKLPAVDDKVLSAWFEKNRAKYDEPSRYDFEEAVLSGERSEAAVRAFAAALNAGTPGDAKAGLRVFKGRPHDNLVQSYGAEFAKALEALPPGGEWQVLSSRDGLRVMRLQAVTPPKPAAFEALRGVALQDWTDVTMAEQRTAAVRALAKKYTVKAEAAAK